MAIRTDLTIDWYASPRLITVAAPSTEITIQDLYDTLKDAEDKMDTMTFPQLIEAAGKEPLGGDVFVGVTATLQNAKIAFEARSGPTWELCTITGGNLVAVDETGASIDVRQPTAFTSVDRASSSSATLTDQENQQYGLYNGGVNLAAGSGNSGTDWPVGSEEYPVDNLADAQIIAAEKGFDRIWVHTPWTFGATDDISGYIIVGRDHIPKTITLTAGVTTNYTVFRDINTGTGGTVSGTTFWEDCTIQNMLGLSGYATNCYFDDSNTIAGNFVCKTSHSGQETGIIPTFDMGGDVGNLVLNEFRGYANIQNCTGATRQFNASLDGCWVTLDSTMTAGASTIIGHGGLTDNSGASHTVNTTYFEDPSAGSGAVTPGDIINIVDGVWDAVTADYTTGGTFGGELATKADLAASSSTNFSPAIAGTIVQGTNGSGSYTDTASKNNVYWEIDEDATNGLTVEFTFNIPDDDKAGIIDLFGRYEGVPSSTHYMELWVYNYESVGWELLSEQFMPGGITSDDTFIHEYFERNIDRTNSNEVKIRLIHNVTTYNATHDLLIDYLAVSSIDTVTAADIADAVWDEDLTTHTTTNSAGAFIQNIWKKIKAIFTEVA